MQYYVMQSTVLHNAKHCNGDNDEDDNDGCNDTTYPVCGSFTHFDEACIVLREIDDCVKTDSDRLNSGLFESDLFVLFVLVNDIEGDSMSNFNECCFSFSVFEFC